MGGNGFVIYFLREDFNILGLSLKSDSSGGGFWYLFDIEYDFVLALELYGIRAGGYWWMCYTLTGIHGTEFLRHWVVRSVHGGPETKITAPPPAQLDSAPLWVIMALLRCVQAFPTLVCVPRGHLGQILQGAESLEVGLWRLYCPPVSCGGNWQVMDSSYTCTSQCKPHFRLIDKLSKTDRFMDSWQKELVLATLGFNVIE